MSNKLCVATRYYDNGEGYCDHHSHEAPIGVFETLDDAINYCLSRDYVEKEVSEFSSFLKEYDVPKVLEDIECPIGKVWEYCDQQYLKVDEDYCNNCWNTNWDNSYDYSYQTVRLYVVSLL